MTKKELRQAVFNKYGGRCAYCGCELKKGWHVDEVEPCRRMYKWEPGHSSGQGRVSVWIPGKMVFIGYAHPDRLHIDNQNPSCASCNINKHSGTLEEFRAMIANFINSLNRYSTQYKIAKRYGLIQEVEKPVVFYFETVKQSL